MIFFILFDIISAVKNMTDKNQIKGMLAALTANLIFGFSFLFSKTALSVAHPLLILAVRFTFAFAALNLLIILGLVKINLRGKKIGGLLLMAIAQPFLYFIFELYGISLTSSALSGLIISLVPVAVMFLSTAFLKEKPTVLQIICSVVSLIGVGAVSVLSNDGNKTTLIGIVLLLLAVVSAAVFNILSRKKSREFSPFERTYFMFLIGFIGFNILAVISLKGDYICGLATAFKNTDFIISILYLSIVSSVAAFILYNYSTSRISVVRSSSFSNIITVVSVIAGILILKEEFSVVQILLCVPIVLGVWGVNLKSDK